MSRYYGGWAPYVPVAERRRKAEKEMEKLRKKGVPVSPVKIEGGKIASTFWGKAWCDNLESYHDYENRLPRGRTYVRNGSVVDLQIAPREVTALVSGSSIYKIRITIGEVAKAHWKAICADCAGGIDSLVELLQGRLSKGVMERLCRQASGLFPKPAEIRFSCSCPDHALMCKHVAAVLYGVGARLDARPELLFRLRAVNENDLVAHIGETLPMAKQAPGAGKVLETGDMAALFGLDMGGPEAPAGKATRRGTKATSPSLGKTPEPAEGKPVRAGTKAASGARVTQTIAAKPAVTAAPASAARRGLKAGALGKTPEPAERKPVRAGTKAASGARVTQTIAAKPAVTAAAPAPAARRGTKAAVSAAGPRKTPEPVVGKPGRAGKHPETAVRAKTPMKQSVRASSDQVAPLTRHPPVEPEDDGERVNPIGKRSEPRPAVSRRSAAPLAPARDSAQPAMRTGAKPARP